LAGVARALFGCLASGELSAGLGVFVPLSVAVPAEHFTTAHVIVSVAAPVWVILYRGYIRLIHWPPPTIGVSGPFGTLGSYAALCVPRLFYARVTCRAEPSSDSRLCLEYIQSLIL